MIALLLAPALTLYSAIILVPIFWSGAYTFFEGNVITGFKFTGLSNFSQFFHDPEALSATWFTVRYAVIVTVAQVALGYGMDRIGPLYPASRQPGSFNALEGFLDRTSTVMAGAGMDELMTFELADERSLYANFGRPSEQRIAVQDPKSRDHSILRDSLIPSLMAALSGNVKEDYPQRVFEIGRVYARDGGGVSEAWNLACLVAHAQSSYTEAKMYLSSVVRILTGAEVKTVASSHWALSAGRTAYVAVAGSRLGTVGEVTPAALEAFGLNVPVAGFEVDLTRLFKQLK